MSNPKAQCQLISCLWPKSAQRVGAVRPGTVNLRRLDDEGVVVDCQPYIAKLALVFVLTIALLPTGVAVAGSASGAAGSVRSASVESIASAAAVASSEPATGASRSDETQKSLSVGDIAGIAGAAIGAVGIFLAYLQWQHPKQMGPSSPEVKTVPAVEARNVLQETVNPMQLAGGIPEVEQRVIDIASQNVYVSPTGTGSNVGLMSSMVATVFLDLFSAATHRPSRLALAEAVAKTVRSACALRHTSFDALAVPKEGNVLLADEAARLLELPLLVVRTARAIRFGDPIEGLRPTGRRVAVVDDISSDGGMLKACIDSLRAAGFNVSDCCCVFERTDGDARQVLDAAGVTLRALNQIDEKVLRELAKL